MKLCLLSVRMFLYLLNDLSTSTNTMEHSLREAAALGAYLQGQGRLLLSLQNLIDLVELLS